MGTLKRKHVVFEGDPHHDMPSAGPVIHPDRQQNAQLSARAEAKAAKATKKSVAKQRYLVKKGKKRRKLLAAKKASAPKNKQFKGDGEGDEEEKLLGMKVDVRDASPVGTGTRSVPVEGESIKARGRLDTENAKAGPSRLPVVVDRDASPAESGLAKNEPASEDTDRDRRLQEKREKKDGQGAKKGKAKSDGPVSKEPSAPAAQANRDGTADDAGEVVNSEGERLRRKEEKRLKRATRDKDRKRKHEVAEDREDEMSDLPDEGLVDEDTQMNLSPSSPPLEAFPVLRPAPAPDPRILARQGLPVGLTDATFVDQDMRIRIDQLEHTYQGVTKKGVSERMVKRLSEIGVEDFFAVQAAILPELLPLRLVPSPYDTLHDYLISAPTGSGKTLAYAIPIIEMMSQRVVTRLRALVVLPTRDLVVQVRETMEALAKGTGLSIGSVTGQHGFTHEQGQLVADLKIPLLGGSSKLDILIATPGRLMDHLAQTPNFTLQHLRFLVIDEADRLLNQSFQNWLSQVLSHHLPPEKPHELPPGVKRLPHDSMAQAWQTRPWFEGITPRQSPCQKLLFSATLTRDPQAIAALDLRSPQYFIVQSPSSEHDAASFGESFALPTSLSEKMLILPPALKPLNLIYLVHHPATKIRGALVFTKSVESAARLVKLLEYFEEAWVEEKVVVRGYTSEMKPAERKRLLAEFAEGRVHLLVCSDLIARGMDLPTVAHVVSYDVPLDMRKYTHRVGRTARAGRAGTAWTLVEKQEALHFKSVLKTAGRERKVRKVKVKEEDLSPYQASYDIAMTRLKEFYGR